MLGEELAFTRDAAEPKPSVSIIECYFGGLINVDVWCLHSSSVGGFGAPVGFVRFCVENVGRWDLSDVMCMSPHVMGNYGMGYSHG